VTTPMVIKHEAIAPYVDVVANVAGRNPGSVIDEVEDKLENIQFPLEHHPELLGEFAERQSAERHMLGVAAAAVMATMQELLRGMQEMSIRQFTLFGQAFQQAVEGGYGVLQATNMADACDHCAKCSQAITETTLRSVHEAVTATCKCGSDVLSAFHGQTASGKSASAAHPVGAAPEKAAA